MRFAAHARSSANKKRLDWLKEHEHLWETSPYDIALTMKELGLYSKTTNYKDAGYGIARQIEYLKKLRDKEKQNSNGDTK